MQLETDSTISGPRGTATIILKDGQGSVLATASCEEIAIGGKPGGAISRNFSRIAPVPEEVSERTASMDAVGQCTGQAQNVFGIDENHTLNVRLVITPIGAEHHFERFAICVHISGLR